MDGGALIFVDELLRFAADVSDRQVTVIADRCAAPLRVAVRGRRGVGRRTVAHALAGAGTDVSTASDADVVVYVVAEVAKPEDTAAVAGVPQPVLVVVNKADVAGGADPTRLARRVRAPVEPMAGLFAVAARADRLDDALWAALRALAAAPADLSSPDRFTAGPHRVPLGLRQRLCDTLDVTGITHAVAAVAQGRSLTQVRALLLRLSGVDAVTSRVHVLGAAVRYQRLAEAVAQLEALAVGDARIGDFLSRDATVLARMSAAADVVEAAGLVVDDTRAEDRAALLRRAIRWQRYSRGPVAAVHRACGADIARGTLRLWSREPA